MNEWLMLGIGLVLTIGTGLFVASEFALVNLDRHDLEKRQAAGESRLSLTISALKITSTHLSSAQLGITLTTLLTGYTFEPAVSSLLEEPLTGLGVPEGAVGGVGTVVGVLLATLFSMVIGELAPKNLALAVPLATAKVVIPFQTLFTTVFKPVVVLLNNTANRLIRSMGIEPKEELSGARSAEELSSLIRALRLRRLPGGGRRHAARPQSAVLRARRRGHDDAAGADDLGPRRRHRRPDHRDRCRLRTLPAARSSTRAPTTSSACSTSSRPSPSRSTSARPAAPGA